MGTIIKTKEHNAYGNMMEKEYRILAEAETLREAIKKVAEDIDKFTKNNLPALINGSMTSYVTYIPNILSTLNKLDRDDKLNATVIGSIVYRDVDIADIKEILYYYYE